MVIERIRVDDEVQIVFSPPQKMRQNIKMRKSKDEVDVTNAIG